ncbi:MerR family transcriptional regulator [Streptomyces sp. NPDC059071]|uniref:MerR family transcriptional regulator n=1 Tax=unclassified Streptomyces TaxID=2593676 RepID=UPI003651F522
MTRLTIGEFATRSRLSPKALRLYDRLGLLVPASVDEATGYRSYEPGQVERARLIALLRGLDMPLARIGELLALAEESGPSAAADLARYWADVEREVAARRGLVAHLRARLSGEPGGPSGEGQTVESTDRYEIRTLEVPERTVLGERRHVLAGELPLWIPEAFGRLARAATERCGGFAGPPFVAYHAEVSEESDGPAEVCVPVADPAAAARYAAEGGHGAALSLRVEPARRVAATRLAKEGMTYPRILTAYAAVEDWLREHGQVCVASAREVYLEPDWDGAAPTDVVGEVQYPYGPA